MLDSSLEPPTATIKKVFLSCRNNTQGYLEVDPNVFKVIFGLISITCTKKQNCKFYLQFLSIRLLKHRQLILVWKRLGQNPHLKTPVKWAKSKLHICITWYIARKAKFMKIFTCLILYDKQKQCKSFITITGKNLISVNREKASPRLEETKLKLSFHIKHLKKIM